MHNAPNGAAIVGERAATSRCDQISCGAARYRRSPVVYARRVQTRFDHSRHLMDYLSLRMASKEDRRAALIAAIEVATNGDHGLPIAIAVIAEFRKRNALLPRCIPSRK
ncbi:MAG: DUF4158 domain-containing protein [Mesorhizobium sp.]|nr:MAG: DUF4158 domain-containing protein [Mesorhizobium sp.]